MGKLGDYDYPEMKPTDAVEAIRLIESNVGKKANLESIASALGHKTTNSGPFRVKIADLNRYGLIIGRGGIGAEELRKNIQKNFFAKDKFAVKLNIQEVSKPNLSAQIVVQNMINDLEKRMPFRRVLKQTIERVRRAGAQGVKVMVSGRLDGAEIARREKLTDGKLPLTKLRADISYANGIAQMTYGVLGVKIWIYRGDIFKK